MRKFDLQSRVRLVPFGVSVAPYLSVADLHCSPSSLEAYPLNTLEAMSMGVPVVRYGVETFTKLCVYPPIRHRRDVHTGCHRGRRDGGAIPRWVTRPVQFLSSAKYFFVPRLP